MYPAGPLPIVAPDGESTRFARRMLDPFVDDIAVRVKHLHDRASEHDLRAFALPSSPVEVRRNADGSVVVEAVGVHHEPVREAVAYRITTPAGVVVISGDTRVCDEVLDFARGASVCDPQSGTGVTESLYSRLCGASTKNFLAQTLAPMMALVSRYSSKPSGPHSRPLPD